MKRQLSKKIRINIKLYRKLKWLTLACVRDYVYDHWENRELSDDNVIRIRQDIQDNVEGFLYWWSNEIHPTVSDHLK
jgi:hypothetical protein